MKFYLAIFTLLLGCNSDDCDQLIQGETLVISDSTKMFIQNYIDAKTIVFENQQNQEVEFKVSELSKSFNSFRFDEECKEDSDKLQTIQTSSEVIELNLVNQDAILSDSIYISLIQVPNKEENIQEGVIVTCGKLNSNNLNQSRVLLSYDNSEIDINFMDSLNINGKTFYSLYEHNNIDWTPKYDIKYTLNQGIVFIKDNITGLELSYLRKE